MIELRLAVAAAALTLTGCSATDDTTAPDTATARTADLEAAIEAAVLREFENRNMDLWDVGTVACEEVPEVEKGVIVDCNVEVDNSDADDVYDDGFPVRVTFEDAAGHFRWVEY